MNDSAKTPNGLSSIGTRLGGLALAATAAIGATIMFASSGSAQDAELSPLTFTERQVIVGRSVFGGGCANCHAEDLRGMDGHPLIRSEWIWFERPIADLFNYIQAAMPLDNPGSLNNRQVAGLVALIAEANGFVAGDVALPEDPAELTGMGFRQPE